MKPAGAILFLPREGGARPVLLKKIFFQPGALWLCEALKAHGIDRFFVVCHEDDRIETAACFPSEATLVTEGSPDASEQLASFLNAQQGEVVVITKPVLFAFPGGAPRDGAQGVCVLSASALVDALGNGTDFEQILHEYGNRDDLARQAIPLQTAWVENDRQARQLNMERLSVAGVQVIDPETVYVDPAVIVEAGTVLLPGTILRGRTMVGRDCELGPNTMICDCVVGNRVIVNASQLNESFLEDEVKVGPFSYIRPNCHVSRGVKIGDFVEVKNSSVGIGTKIPHLTYVGDSDVGGGVNLGCGTVTVNYDGTTKFRTTIGDRAFIGCNTNLVAPVKVGEGAYTAAGSTITSDVPPDSLAIARSVQVVKKQWAVKRLKK